MPRGMAVSEQDRTRAMNDFSRTAITSIAKKNGPHKAARSKHH